MKKNLTTTFNARKHMNADDFEIFYYHDVDLAPVTAHKHSHYEFYLFLEGSLDYEINGIIFPLIPGDFLLMPPDLSHRPCIHDHHAPYRRIVLWVSTQFYNSLCQHFTDLSYGYEFVRGQKSYHFSPDFIISQDIQGKLLELLEELHSTRPFHALHCNLKVITLLAYVNRVICASHSHITIEGTPLYLRLCDYINLNLHKDLSLDLLSKEFYVSKYHISHTFKQHIGLGLHQYITKKRLHAIKNSIPSGIPLTQLAQHYGFMDYTSFYRSFKKEYQVSPAEYKKQVQSIENYKSEKNLIF